MLNKRISVIVKSSTVKFGILAAGSAVFIGMPCPCCGGNSCAVGLLSAAVTGAAINASGVFVNSLRQKLNKR